MSSIEAASSGKGFVLGAHESDIEESEHGGNRGGKR
jgi:hypothetical protein